MKIFLLLISLSILITSCKKDRNVLNLTIEQTDSTIFAPKDSLGWRLQYENNDSITYYGVHFTDQQKGWIIGYSGIIKKSEDGGDSWNIQPSNLSSNLWDLCFINSKTGWICGENNTLLKTTDSGKKWNIIMHSINSDTVNVEIKFIDELKGWMSNNQGEILKSKDGGMNWKVKWRNNIGGSSLEVFDENTVYFLNRKLYKTYDGGSTWDSLVVPTSKYYRTYKMYFTDPQIGYLTTVNGTGGTILTEYPIYLTKDGGSTWQTSEYLNSESFGFTTIFFIDKNNGWVAGKDVYKTIDGGDNWTLEDSLKYNTQNVKDMYFIAENFNEKIGWLINYDGQIFKYIAN